MHDKESSIMYRLYFFMIASFAIVILMCMHKEPVASYKINRRGLSRQGFLIHKCKKDSFLDGVMRDIFFKPSGYN